MKYICANGVGSFLMSW